MDSTQEDFISLLEASGYEAFPFDITSLSDGQYYITFNIKEYKDGNKVHDDILGGYNTYTNMRLLSDFPNESQENLKTEKMDDPERGIFRMAKKLMIGFTPSVNDTIRPVMLEVENMASRNVQLLMHPQYVNNDSVNGKKLYMYLTRPFKTGEFAIGKFIPLVLFGSAWYDEDWNIHRFCGENEIDPDMSSEILQFIPHYYVIGIEIKPVKML